MLRFLKYIKALWSEWFFKAINKEIEMPANISPIIIVDDSVEDGRLISNSIQAAGYSARYIEYKKNKLFELSKNKLRGVRIVFMDIHLIPEGTSGEDKNYYSAVQKALESILDQKNGPYIMITWSEYSDKSKDLYSFLDERLTKELIPVSKKELDKEDYKNLDREEDLTKIVKEYLNELEGIGCLINWEEGISYSASETLYEILKIARNLEGNLVEKVGKVVGKLAKASAGNHLAKENSVDNLHNVLAEILFDQMTHQQRNQNDEFGQMIYDGSQQDVDGGWHSRINSMLHLDTQSHDAHTVHIPGDVFKYPENNHDLPLPMVIDKIDFFKSQFYSGCIRGDLNGPEKEELNKNFKLLLMEITPPCDYAQNKFTWHRYIVGVQIPTKFMNSKNKVNVEFLCATPEFTTDDQQDYKIVFNSKLIISLEPEKANALNRPFMRIRQVLLADMMGWLGRMVTRQGHLSLE